MAERGHITAGDLSWLSNPGHHTWLFDQAQRLLSFYQYACMDPAGGFFELDNDGRPQQYPIRKLVITSRMVHNFSLATLLGRPGAAPLVDHGIRFLREALRDNVHGGYYCSVDSGGAHDASKQAYGHVFVLLAASSAMMARRPGAEELFQDIVPVLESRFWREADGLLAEEFNEDWSTRSSYRGQNANMHYVEALLTAAEATHDSLFLRRAERIAEKLIHDLTARNDWRLAEHYNDRWEIDPDYSRDDPDNMFRTFGSVVGHWVEWARLLLQIRAMSAQPADWLLPAARRLFDGAMAEAWDRERGGLAHTVDFDGKILNPDRYQWVISEAIGAAARLVQVTGEPEYEHWYRTLWDYADRHLIDHVRGGWLYALDAENRAKNVPDVIEAKPDLYHALQCCLIPLLPADAGIGASLRDGKYFMPARQ